MLNIGATAMCMMTGLSNLRFTLINIQMGNDSPEVMIHADYIAGQKRGSVESRSFKAHNTTLQRMK